MIDNNIVPAYQKAQSRLLLLDYDGTVADIKPTPPEAKPTSEQLKLLKQLARDAKNTVVIITGRDHQTLDAWLGGLPLEFASEHGLLIKERGRAWRAFYRHDNAWKEKVRPIIDEYNRDIPGSFIEEKAGSFAWHYRAATDQTKAIQAVQQMLERLKPIAAAEELALLQGNKVLDIKLAGVDKGTVAKHWLAKRKWDFILAAGDDTTDEDLFRVMPDHTYTIKVRPGPSIADIRIDSPRDFRSLLGKFV